MTHEPTGQTFKRAGTDAYQDACENTPFASIGGLDARQAMRAPEYISTHDAAEYLAGYESACLSMYGESWRSVEFGWAPALTIEAESKGQ